MEFIANGPLFNPSEAPYFGPSAVVYPSLTGSVTTSTPLTRSSALFSSISSGVANSTLSSSTFSRNSTTTSHSSTHSSTHLSTSSVKSTTSLTTRSRSSTASATVPAETGAGVVNLSGAVGVIAGGLIAGLAML
jgi:hypothetical protein